MNKTDGTKRAHASFSQKRLVDELLAKVVEKLPDDLCRYAPGYNDATVAAETGVAQSIVRNIRREVYGSVRIPKPAVLAEVAEDVEMSGRKIAALETLILNIAGLLGCDTQIAEYHAALIATGDD